MRAYHRLDISYTTTKKTKWGERSWIIGTYNLYNRRNPFFIDLRNDHMGNKKFVQYSLFPIIPSVAYRLNFKRMIMNKVCIECYFHFLTACELIVDIDVPLKKRSLRLILF